MQQVALVLRYIHQYRLPFLLRLHEECMQAGIDLKVIYGDPEEAKSILGEILLT